MTGPADHPLARHSLARTVESLPEVVPASPPEPSGSIVPSSLRRHTRRGALGLLLAAASLFAVERHSAYADDAPPEGGETPLDAAPPPEGSDAPAAPPADASAPAAPPPDGASVVVPSPPVSPVTYVVASGDTIYSISRRYGVSVDAILWANKLTDPNVVKVGQKLVIPPATGKLHVVKDGDTLDSLAQTYSVSKAGIAAVNGLDDGVALTAGQRLLIPVSIKPPAADPAFAPAPLVAANAADPQPIAASGATGSPTPPLISSIAPLITAPGLMSPTTGTGGPTVNISNKKLPQLAWPFPLKAPTIVVTQGFHPGHTGIDECAPAGTPIGACAPGTVKLAEKDPPGFSGYGWIVIIDHGDGISTWYAHLGSFAVKAGDHVETGQRIGTVGMTGRTTGPHLHLELRVNTTPMDARLALPPA